MWSDHLRRWRDAALVTGEYSANAVVGLIEPRLRVSGATPTEAAPSQVWPWLAQLGYGRGGWYADMPWWRGGEGRRGGGSSSDHRLPEHERLEVGQVLLDGPGSDETTGAWTVRACEPCRALVLFSSRTVSGREVVPASASAPRVYFDCSWAFVLRPVQGSSRLVVRVRVGFHPPHGPIRWITPGLAAGDTAMQRAMLLGIKRRVEETQRARRGVTIVKVRR